NDTGEVVLTEVAPGSPSAKAGILPGDILVAADGRALEKNPTDAQVFGKVNGWVGTSANLTVRTGAAAPRAVSVVRTPEPGSIADRLGALGVGIDAIINEILILDILVLLVYLAVSFMIISRGHGTALTYFASIALVTFSAAATSSVQLLTLENSVWGVLAVALVPTGYAAAFTFLGFLYPDGRWVPRWSRVLVGIVWAWTFLQWFVPAARPANWAPGAALAAYLLMIVAMFASQMRRYRRVATPAQREQIKWFVAALASVVAGYAISQTAALLVNGPTRASNVAVFILWQMSVVCYQIPYALMAVAIGLALLKHRLWDIEIVINQSLVYSALTAALAVLSAAVLAVTTTLIGKIFGNVSKLLAVAATAAFPVAAFNPLRQRIQRLVDRKMKPEEVSFAETSTLLGLEVQALLPPAELLGTLVQAVAGQLGLDSAAAYVPEAGESLRLAREAPLGAGAPEELQLDGAVRESLRQGRLVPMPEGSGFTFLVPLTTSRTLGHAFCGVLALGRRRNGRGYTTPLEHGLRQLGVDAGKALYVARLRESRMKV
ncbi:MAG TPA: PDZ domain-containing protein, partial [Candidatus Bathyarchaeia archaeon]|nr:PDZ domain-containing protein [Candidatus Bathyarchaeia archaeon]